MTTSCYPDSSLLVWPQEVFFHLAERQLSGSQRCTLLQDRSLEKEGSFKWCSISRQKLAPTGKCMSSWNCVFNRHLGICSSSPGFQLTVDLTPFPVDNSTHQHVVSTILVQTAEREGKGIARKTSQQHWSYVIFFKWGKTIIITNCCVWVFPKRSFMQDPDNSKVPWATLIINFIMLQLFGRFDSLPVINTII